MSPRPNPFGVIVPYLITYNERVSQKKGFIHIFIIKLIFMKKIVRLTEEDLVRIVKKVIAEQAVVGISAPKAPAPSKPAQLSSTISSGGIKTNPQEFYKKFPCMGVPGVKLVNGKYMFKGKVLLPEELPYNDSGYQEANNRPDVYKKQIGKVQGGGYYFCSNYFPDGKGLVMKA